MDSCRSAAAQQRLPSLKTRTELWFGHGCSGQRMLLEHDGNYGLGMDALVSVCSWNTKGIMVSAWMLWSAYALGTRRELWFGRGCSGQRVLLEHEQKAVVSALIKTRTELWFGHGCSGERDAFGARENFLALAVFRESRKLQKCSIHCRRIPDESKFLHFAETRALPSPRKCAKYCEGQ